MVHTVHELIRCQDNNICKALRDSIAYQVLYIQIIIIINHPFKNNLVLPLTIFLPFFIHTCSREETMKAAMKDSVAVPMNVAITVNACWDTMKEMARYGNIQCKSDIQVSRRNRIDRF